MVGYWKLVVQILTDGVDEVGSDAAPRLERYIHLMAWDRWREGSGYNDRRNGIIYCELRRIRSINAGPGGPLLLCVR